MDSRKVEGAKGKKEIIKGQSGAKKGKKSSGLELKNQAASGTKQIDPKLADASAVNMQTN